ncbi:MAG: hypothetical protein AAFZ63_12110 [Bacteroidota bacterium]
MKKSLSWTLLGLIVLLINACLDDDTSPQPDLYEGCCSVEPGQFSMNGVNIYVPSAFTPDNNGINDLFTIFGSNNSSGDIIIFSIVLTDRDNNELFRTANIQPNQNNISWDGIDGEGEAYEGLFNYKITLSPGGGDTETYTGQACAVRCEDDEQGNLPNISDPGSCAFPLNHDGEGGYDPFLPSGENSNCF